MQPEHPTGSGEGAEGGPPGAPPDPAPALPSGPEAATAAPDPGADAQAPTDDRDFTENLTALTKAVSDGDITGEDLGLAWSAVGLPVAKALVLVIVVLLLSRWVGSIVVRAATRARIEITLARFFANMARWAVLILGALTVLQTFSIEITSFAAVLASVGFAIGLAMSGMLGNIAAGVLLLVFRPYRVGDFVNAGGVSGTVYEIELFTTSFDTPDNRRIIVPNGEIFGKVIENITYHPKRRVEIAVGTAYDADIDRTRSVLLAAATSVEGRTREDEPAVVLDELGASSINWKIRVWAPKDQIGGVRERLIRDIKVALDSAEISIPYPHMEVRVAGAAAPSPAGAA